MRSRAFGLSSLARGGTPLPPTSSRVNLSRLSRLSGKKGAKAALPDDDDYEPPAPPLPPGDGDDDEEPINLVFKGRDEAGERGGGTPHRRRGRRRPPAAAPQPHLPLRRSPTKPPAPS
ncbi:Os08g0240883 [Oryza sativa Japonica Group]|uniref:Uncharacterized protein n=2 Tax=Oryza sativa subsp. japonica TaxID=39947 RepID=A0A0P0XDB3_ORYSJ|nr:hypothetical protein [Oryza sativa Japonica Group]BAD05564.1 hypothetical protein [Oryza sativa Japonica Group]BAT04495.1 Os08g0240883 [Oryza sativa Japonica Group]